MRVSDPDGVEWEVSRQWLHVPRWRVGRPRLEDVLDASLFTADDLAALGVSVLVVVLLFVLFVLGLPLVVLAAALLFAVGGLLTRVLFRRPWLVRACSERGELEWRVRGAIGSRRGMHEVARALERGDRSVVPAGAERVLPDSPLQQLR